MSSRTLRLGARGEDVRDLQQMLAEAGHDPGPIDAVFGQATHRAVVAFQQARGLEPDGAVGPVTRAALVQAALGGATEGTPRGRSLHIGLNLVDPAAYPFPVPPLRGCHNDANAMRDLAVARGFSPNQRLLDAEATSQRVSTAIKEAAAALHAGDIFFLTYAGHGSYVPDQDGDEAADARDETWVLWDRQMLDDELYALWGEFDPGVRILLISDSCHSGSVSRFFPVLLGLGGVDPAQVAAFEPVPAGAGARGGVADVGPERLPVRLRPETADDLALCIAAAVPSVLGGYLGTRPDPMAGARIANAVKQVLLTPQERDLEDEERERMLDPAIAATDFMARSALYEAAKAAARAATPPQSRRILLLSGCQDNQTSGDGATNGLFTSKLLHVLSEGYAATEGRPVDYADLHRRILREMPARQTPALYWAVGRDAAFEQQVPFAI